MFCWGQTVEGSVMPHYKREDPLAELARLIGQEDPFAGLEPTPARPTKKNDASERIARAQSMIQHLRLSESQELPAEEDPFPYESQGRTRQDTQELLWRLNPSSRYDAPAPERQVFLKGFWRHLTLAVYDYARDTHKPPWDKYHTENPPL